MMEVFSSEKIRIISIYFYDNDNKKKDTYCLSNTTLNIFFLYALCIITVNNTKQINMFYVKV